MVALSMERTCFYISLLVILYILYIMVPNLFSLDAQILIFYKANHNVRENT